MSEETDKFNLENWKADARKYAELLKKLVRLLPSDLLISELKRRKLISFDWIKGKWKQK